MCDSLFTCSRRFDHDVNHDVEQVLPVNARQDKTANVLQCGQHFLRCPLPSDEKKVADLGRHIYTSIEHEQSHALGSFSSVLPV